MPVDQVTGPGQVLLNSQYPTFGLLCQKQFHTCTASFFLLAP